jgi:apolipoprotein D and lipocalin family protein
MINIRWLLAPLLLTASSIPLQAEADFPDPDLRTVSHVDLPRYMGRWYVISHVPNFLERGKVATSDNYTLLADGTLRNVFKFREESFAAPEKEWSGPGWVTNPTTNASWKVRLFWPFKVGYLILELDPNYGWAVASSGTGSLFWVLSRTRTLDHTTYADILERLRRRRLDASRLELVPQPSVEP